MRSRLWMTVVTAALAWWLATPGPSRAQHIGWGEYDRALGQGAVISYGQEPFSHRYNFYAGPALYLNGCAGKRDYLEYIDRVERAERFGYRIPSPPPGWVPVYSRPRP